MLSDNELELLKNIREHLYKLHSEWQNRCETGEYDGHHKGNEGYVGLIISYPNWFEADDYLNDKPTVGCEIYSYLFGPHRLHEFSSLEEAWKNVKEWG